MLPLLPVSKDDSCEWTGTGESITAKQTAVTCLGISSETSVRMLALCPHLGLTVTV